MFGQLLPNKNKNTTVQHSAATVIRISQFGDLSKALDLDMQVLALVHPWIFF
jgi:hypothetical protein